MFALITYLFALALAGLAGAQTNVTTPAVPFNPGTIDPALKSSWCRGQLAACPAICGGSIKNNFCDPASLDWTCVCANGTSPDVAAYMNTIPYYECEATYGQCIDANPNNLDGQQACKDAAKCGTLNATGIAAAASSSAAAAAASSTTAASTSSASATAAQSASSTSPAPSASSKGAAIKIGQDYGVGIMATIFLAAFKFLL